MIAALTGVTLNQSHLIAMSFLRRAVKGDEIIGDANLVWKTSAFNTFLGEHLRPLSGWDVIGGDAFADRSASPHDEGSDPHHDRRYVHTPTVPV